MNISLPEALKSFVDEQVASRGYGISTEYIRGALTAQGRAEKGGPGRKGP